MTSESRRADEGVSAVSRVVPGLFLLLLLGGCTGGCWALQAPAVISGTVRDAHGVPQMGTLVQLLRPDASTAASCLSDDRGKYVLPPVMPGQYRMRATAAFFLPISKDDVRLQAGARAVINLTMTTLFEADNWLPTQRRKADEPADDWKWALRSMANRPLLRLVDPEDGSKFSTSAGQTQPVTSQGQVVVMNGDGSFGDGGMHQALLLDRMMEDGDGAVLRADVGEVDEAYAPGPSVEVFAGCERRTPMGGSTRVVASVQSHPELTDGRDTDGYQVMRLASTQEFSLGDTFLIDVGALLQAERMSGTQVDVEPYVRVMARPTDDVVLEYRYASGRELQSSEDLDQLQPVVTAVVDDRGRPLVERGMHQEVSISRKLGSTVATAEAYIDRFPYGAMSGTGVMRAETIRQSDAVADTMTDTFEVAAPGYGGHGVGVSLMQPLTTALGVWAEVDDGTALEREGGLDLTRLATGVHPTMAPAFTVALRGRVLRSDTWLRVEYRWQPLRTLTQVNAYNVLPQEAYLTFYVRQRLWCGRLLPDGLDAFVLGTNLLKQGYQPVQAPDGAMLVLAEAPQVVQGGLSFNF